MLGRRYSVYGHVAHGRGLGEHRFHCPTANLTDEQIILPPAGVYAARAFLEGEEQCPHGAAVYIGSAPTLDDTATAAMPTPVLEVHLLDFHKNLYGAAMEVEFFDFIRPDMRFCAHHILSAQIQKDIAAARDILAGTGAPSVPRSQ